MLKIKYIQLSELIPYINNTRTHLEQQVQQIASSIKEFGFTNPVLIDEQGGVIAGHGRIMASKMLKIDEVPTITLAGLTEAQKKAYIIADNKLALNAGWDEELLKLEIENLQEMNFDIDLLGFSFDELEDLGIGQGDSNLDESKADEVPELEENPVIKLGDLIELGHNYQHRLLCGDSTKEEDVARLMDGKKADLLHTDPPYNVDYSNADRPKPSKKDLGKIKNDTMGDEEFYNFLHKFYMNAFNSLKDGSSAYIWHSDRETINFKQAGINAGFVFAQTIIWKKPMLLSRTRYQWAHEPCLFMVKGSPYFTDDRTKTTVWDFGGYDKSKNVHPTQKPVFIPEEAINNSSKIGSLVLDLFSGSGSTLVGCENLSRTFFGMEFDTKYAQVIIQRYVDYTSNPKIKINGKEVDWYEYKERTDK